jgi:hypothetical protein
VDITIEKKIYEKEKITGVIHAFAEKGQNGIRRIYNNINVRIRVKNRVKLIRFRSSPVSI